VVNFGHCAEPVSVVERALEKGRGARSRRSLLSDLELLPENVRA
jgi:hypothetical protein